jgi:hypothetical protein
VNSLPLKRELRRGLRSRLRLRNIDQRSLFFKFRRVIAVFAVQNITPVSLRLFVFESIQLPIGILLAFCIGFGLILGAFLPLLWQRPAKRRTRIEDMDEFDFEE